MMTTTTVNPPLAAEPSKRILHLAHVLRLIDNLRGAIGEMDTFARLPGRPDHPFPSKAIEKNWFQLQMDADTGRQLLEWLRRNLTSCAIEEDAERYLPFLDVMWDGNTPTVRVDMAEVEAGARS